MDADGWTASREGSAESSQYDHQAEAGNDDKAVAHARLERLGSQTNTRAGQNRGGLFEWVENNITAPIRETIIEPVVETAEDVGELIEDNVTKPIVENVIKPAADTVEDIGDYVEDNITQPYVEHIIKPVQSLAEGAADIVTDYVDHSLQGLEDILQGDVASGIEELFDANTDLQLGPTEITVDAGVLGIQAQLEVIDNLFGIGNERGLTAEEIAYLRPIYGDSIDYSSVRIQQGGTFESLTDHDGGITVGNEIFLPNTNDSGEPIFHPDGTLTSAGTRLLGHEAAHVWQYQNEGSGYISSSIGEQLIEGSEAAYDWQSAVSEGTSFEDMGVEQQAELAEAIGVAIQAEGDDGKPATLQPKYFEIDGRTVTNAEWTIIQAAHASLLAG